MYKKRQRHLSAKNSKIIRVMQQNQKYQNANIWMRIIVKKDKI